MSLVFYGHPFSSYCQKVLIAVNARALLDKSYDWLETRLTSECACGKTFTLADCAAVPTLPSASVNFRPHDTIRNAHNQCPPRNR